MSTLTALTTVVGSHGEHDGYWFPFAFLWLVVLGLVVWFVVAGADAGATTTSRTWIVRGASWPSASPAARSRARSTGSGSSSSGDPEQART